MKARTATRWGPMMVIAFAIVALALASPQAVMAKSDSTPQYAFAIPTPSLDLSDGSTQALKPATALAYCNMATAYYAESMNPATPSGGPMARHVKVAASHFGVVYAKTDGAAGAATTDDVKTEENGPIAARTNV